ncbi:MAG: sensor histidine kinase [Haloferacaceae archaeon]
MEGPLDTAVPHPERVALELLGAGFTLSYVVFFYLFRDAREIADASLDGYLEVILLGVPSIVLFGGAVWLRDSGVNDDFHSRVAKWAFGTAVVFAVAVATVVFVIEAQFDSGERVLLILMSLGFGASAGTMAGILKSIALQRERERNQTLATARRRERERKQLEHLNHYLRHEVLNEAQKIIGHAAVLEEQLDADEKGEHLTVIRRSGDDISEFIQSIRTILKASDHDPELDAVDVSSVLETEANALRRLYPSARITIDGRESTDALAGELVNRIFRNLLENAIVHNDAPVTITTTVETSGNWVTVRIRDDGSGIPEGERESLFSAPNGGDHGYGLFFANNLAEIYGGELELVRTGTEGTEFSIRLGLDSQARSSTQEVEDSIMKAV